MTEITVRLLDESEWSVYRDVRLRALAESPGSFTATLAEEADRDEQFWRDRMIGSAACRTGLGTTGNRQPRTLRAGALSGEVFGLYVVPEARVPASLGASSRPRRLATQQAYLQLYYWVGTDNGRAVGFANNFGFRTTDYRRPSRSSDLEPGEEMAMVLSLEPDVTGAEPDQHEGGDPRRPPQLRSAQQQALAR